ncbi:MAG: HEAT repeat domain-containing protein [Planctomycetes bacterium]|nr:HEAT repeat domain-containing protein [Planctomycetota bacterium]
MRNAEWVVAVLACLCWAEEAEPELEGKPLSQWVRQLRSDNRGLQVRAARTLGAAPGELHAGIVPLVLPVLKSERENDKFAAAQVLGECGPAARKAVPDLLPMLEGTQYERNRAAAAKALGQILKEAKPDAEIAKVTEALIVAFRDKYSDVRREAVKACGVIGLAAKACIPHLKTPLAQGDQLLGSHQDQEYRLVRRAAAWTCGRMGPLAAGHMDLLISRMHAEGQHCPEIVEAIGLIGPVHDNVVPNILDKMEQKDGGTVWQTESWQALQRFGAKAEAVLPFAKRFITEPRFYGTNNSREREALVIEVLRFLRVAGPKAVDCLPQVENLANYKYPYNEEDDMTPVMRKEAAKTAAILKERVGK